MLKVQPSNETENFDKAPSKGASNKLTMKGIFWSIITALGVIGNTISLVLNIPFAVLGSVPSLIVSVVNVGALVWGGWLLYIHRSDWKASTI